MAPSSSTLIEGKVTAFAASPDGRVAVGFLGGRIATFDPSGAAAGVHRPKPGASESASALSWLPDGSALVSSDGGRVSGAPPSPCLHVMDPAGARRATYPLPEDADELCVTPDGKHVLCEGAETVRVLDIASGRELRARASGQKPAAVTMWNLPGAARPVA